MKKEELINEYGLDPADVYNDRAERCPACCTIALYEAGQDTETRHLACENCDYQEER